MYIKGKREKNSDEYIGGLYDSISEAEENEMLDEDSKRTVAIIAVLSDIAKSLARISDMLESMKEGDEK